MDVEINCVDKKFALGLINKFNGPLAIGEVIYKHKGGEHEFMKIPSESIFQLYEDALCSIALDEAIQRNCENFKHNKSKDIDFLKELNWTELKKCSKPNALNSLVSVDNSQNKK